MTWFNQAPPRLGNQFANDTTLKRFLDRTIPAQFRADFDAQLMHAGELAGGELYEMQLADRENEPTLTQWNAWGERIDHIELTPLWKRAATLSAELGLVATAYEKKYGEYARVLQFALAYLIGPSTDV